VRASPAGILRRRRGRRRRRELGRGGGAAARVAPGSDAGAFSPVLFFGNAMFRFMLPYLEENCLSFSFSFST
jgi:hypothetical protein